MSQPTPSAADAAANLALPVNPHPPLQPGTTTTYASFLSRWFDDHVPSLILKRPFVKRPLGGTVVVMVIIIVAGYVWYTRPDKGIEVPPSTMGA